MVVDVFMGRIFPMLPIFIIGEIFADSVQFFFSSKVEEFSLPQRYRKGNTSSQNERYLEYT